MNVVFFKVENVLNFDGSDAKAPDGRMGISEARVKELKRIAQSENARLVLYGEWAKEWDFEDVECTACGSYLNKKLDRRGMHILGKAEDITAWLNRHTNVEKYCILNSIDDVRWVSA